MKSPLLYSFNPSCTGQVRRSSDDDNEDGHYPGQCSHQHHQTVVPADGQDSGGHGVPCRMIEHTEQEAASRIDVHPTEQYSPRTKPEEKPGEIDEPRARTRSWNPKAGHMP